MNAKCNRIVMDLTHNSCANVDNSKDVKSLRVIGCVLLNYDKCKMQPMSNGFNMIQMYNSTHVDS
jgi:hypothetical protein